MEQLDDDSFGRDVKRVISGNQATYIVDGGNITIVVPITRSEADVYDTINSMSPNTPEEQ